MAERREHWENVYHTKRAGEVSWYRAHLDVSLELIEEAVPDRDARIIDVGAGASTLVDDLLAGGYGNVAVMDLSSTALGVSEARLGDRGAKVERICGDVLDFPFARHRFDLWHDRAVFHFLTNAADRAAYVRQLTEALKPGGHAVIATFAPDGPAKCSGLEVVRYDADSLAKELGPGFRLVRHRTELHRTPTGATQPFTYCLLARSSQSFD